MGFGEDGVEGGFRQFWGAGENPEVFCRTTADERPLVIGVEQHHTIVAIERPKERDTQQSWGVGSLGLAK